ncbi:TIGR03032 family protein [Azospirillum sp. ST 5-10]|uniref:TIGR03032 family protein n=1 Tax=unclassified Azospirillum TaxID=2630922 RepID=UPI003F4A5A2C
MIDGSPRFGDWLAGEGAAVAFTTYQSGRLFLLGLGAGDRLRAQVRRIPRCQGMWSDGQTLWVGGEAHLWRFDNVLPDGARTANGSDRLFEPRQCLATGDVDIHDIAVGGDGRPVFVNTAFSCLAVPGPGGGFHPLWRPPFVSEMKAEDRCHLNGLALDGEGRPAYVTAFARTDAMEGWREHRVAGGVLIDVASGETVCGGLSMPHSPRLRDGRLWLLNSGTGEFGTVDLTSGRFEAVCFCPGYARGLSFVGKWAVIGLSRPRRGNSTFEGLPLDDRLAAKGVGARCGLAVVDITTGTLAHALTIHHTVDELYDVAVLAGARRPEARTPVLPTQTEPDVPTQGRVET